MPDLSRTVRSLLVAAMLLASLAPASAAPASQKGRPIPADSLGWKAYLAQTVSGRGDAETLGLALRGAVEELAGVSAPVVEPASGVDGSTWDEGYLQAVPAGDLDADGLEDVLEYVFLYSFDEWDFVYEERTSAVRSSDGEALWTLTGEDRSVYVVPAGDLDGQGGDDLLAFTISWADVPATWFWLVGVAGIRGSDGTELWSRTYPNPFTYAGSGPTWTGADVDYAIPLQVGGDADADGVQDLLVGRYTFAGAWDDATDLSLSAGGAVFEYVSGRTGAPISASPVAGDGWADAAAIPDADGDGAADLATIEGSWGAPGGTVSARSGRTGRAVWSASLDLPANAWSFLQGADLSGDGAGDVLVRSYTFIEDEWDFYFGPQQVDALSGADGTSLWGIALPAFTRLYATGDADGDGGGDLLTFPEDDRWAPPELRSEHLFPDFLMLSGAAGSKVWGKSPAKLSRPVPAGDLDADGVLDVLGSRPHRDGARAYTGATGSLLWGYTNPMPTRQVALWGDLDGDGTDDLADVRRSNPRPYRVRRGDTGKTAWAPWKAPRGRSAVLGVGERTGGGPGILFESSRGGGELTLAGRSSTGKLIWERSLGF